VTAIEGSFTLNGVAAALSYKRLMTAVKATFTLNGPATNLIWSGAGAKTMPAAPGVFVLSGKAATFKQTAVVKATVTTYALTGFPPTLAAGLRMTASTGSFISAGQAATFHYGRGFGAGAGAFVVTGKSASLLRLVINRYSMPAQAGAVSVGGNWVDLWRSGTEQPGSMHFGRVVYLHRW
jgi:hypothetical protein